MPTAMDLNLDLLLPSIAAGDKEAFGRFVAGAEPSVRRGLRSFARHVDTEAVVQEAFLRVWQVAPRFVPDGRDNGLLRLAARIAHNLAVSELRRHKRHEPLDETGEIATGATEVLAVDPLLRRVIVLCIEKLAGPTRAALDARLESGGTEPDAMLAERVGMRPNTFLQNVTRGRKLIADCLEQNGVTLSGSPRPTARLEAP